VAQQISYLYSISVHTLLSKLRITVTTTYLVLPESSGKEEANGGMYTVSSTSHVAQSPVLEHTDATHVSLFCAVTSVSSS
jgi:hypothetical protein